jgi:hypothetical protein
MCDLANFQKEKRTSRMIQPLYVFSPFTIVTSEQQIAQLYETPHDCHDTRATECRVTEIPVLFDKTTI